jgi:2-oxo-4-hydroxy-4-carboxy-5-ureidoimidazoline decarboxylase
MTALADVNGLDRAAFVAAFGSVFEHSPWVAEDAAARRPFAGLDDLHGAFAAALRAAPRARQLALIRAHPELAGREAQAGELTRESAREQSSAGLDRLSGEQVRALRALNAAYRERFGFPLVICVREHSFASLMAFGAARLGHDAEAEVDVALGEIAKIARLRLEDVVA